MTTTTTANVRDSFTVTSSGLNRNSPSFRLYQKAKKLGMWDPSDIDFTQDKIDFQNMSQLEKDWVVRQIALFVTGEEAVTLDLLPLIMTVAKEDRLDEEMFLTSFLFEEAKHVDFFTRYLEEVIGDEATDLGRFHTKNYVEIFYNALPKALDALMTDSSPAAQVRASITYNMIVEGVLAESGYNGWFKALRAQGNLLPGMQEGLRLIKRDESRHIAYGVYFLSRHIVADPSLWDVVEETFAYLMPFARGFSTDSIERYENPPFAQDLEANRAYLVGQYQKRYARLAKARGSSMEELYRLTNEIIENNDG